MPKPTWERLNNPAGNPTAANQPQLTVGPLRSPSVLQRAASSSDPTGPSLAGKAAPPTAGHHPGRRAPNAEQLRHLTQSDLARRWQISARTLERWRWLDQGPAYLKLCGAIADHLEDVEAYEAAQRRAP